jgi:Sulfatase-modifying factor enzyme 1
LLGLFATRALLLALGLLIAVAGTAQEAAARGPLKQHELVFLLSARVSSKRLIALVRRYGIDFPVQASALENLEAAGADAPLLAELRRFGVRASLPSAPPVAGPALPSPSPGASAASVAPIASPANRPPASTRSPAAAPTPHPLEPDLALVHAASGDFRISRREVTNRQYLSFCSRARHSKPEPPFWSEKPGFKELPVVNVSWWDARDYCDWLSNETGRSYRLPTEKEWEWAASGGAIPKTKTYPWGDGDPKDRACFGLGRLCRVGSFGRYAGLYDMAGNVAEWVKDADGSNRIVKGGSWTVSPEKSVQKPSLPLSIASRERLDPKARKNDVGFRVVRDQ